MNNQFTPGSVWFHNGEQREHQILHIEEGWVATISPPAAFCLPESTLEKAEVVSWHGTHRQFEKAFSPPAAA